MYSNILTMSRRSYYEEYLLWEGVIDIVPGLENWFENLGFLGS